MLASYMFFWEVWEDEVEPPPDTGSYAAANDFFGDAFALVVKS